MSFFIRNKNQRGAKRKNGAISERPKSYKEKKRAAAEDEISSHSEAEENESHVDSESDEDEETAQEKRLRLTKEYLKEIENQGLKFLSLNLFLLSIELKSFRIFSILERERRDDAEIDKSVIAHRLRDDLLEQSGKLRRTVADLYLPVDTDKIRNFQCKDHKLPITCLTISTDCQWLFTASKDCTIVKWSLAQLKKMAVLKRIEKSAPNTVKGHKTAVQSLAISTDGKFLASGDLENQIHIWNPENMQWIHTFKGTFLFIFSSCIVLLIYLKSLILGHRAGITGLVFRRSTHTLFSASMDRTVKIWNLDEMSYVETL